MYFTVVLRNALFLLPHKPTVEEASKDSVGAENPLGVLPRSYLKTDRVLSLMLNNKFPGDPSLHLLWLELNHGTLFDSYQVIKEGILGFSLTRYLGTCCILISMYPGNNFRSDLRLQNFPFASRGWSAASFIS